MGLHLIKKLHVQMNDFWQSVTKATNITYLLQTLIEL